MEPEDANHYSYIYNNPCLVHMTKTD